MVNCDDICGKTCPHSVTETGGIAITPRPSSPGAEIKPSMPMRPFFGIEPVICGEQVCR